MAFDQRVFAADEEKQTQRIFWSGFRTEAQLGPENANPGRVGGPPFWSSTGRRGPLSITEMGKKEKVVQGSLRSDEESRLVCGQFRIGGEERAPTAIKKQ